VLARDGAVEPAAEVLHLVEPLLADEMQPHEDRDRPELHRDCRGESAGRSNSSSAADERAFLEAKEKIFAMAQNSA
jgi:hypothetical protein